RARTSATAIMCQLPTSFTPVPFLAALSAPCLANAAVSGRERANASRRSAPLRCSTPHRLQRSLALLLGTIRVPLLRHGLHDQVVADFVRHRIRDHPALPEPLVVELEELPAVDELHEGVVHEVAPLRVVLWDHAGVGVLRE